MTPVLNPARCRLPEKRACSILRHRSDQEDVHAHGGETRGQSVLDHVARATRVLAYDHAMGVPAVGEVPTRRLPEPERGLGRHRIIVRPTADAVGTEELSRHACL
jgi:hypothetical protein